MPCRLHQYDCAVDPWVNVDVGTFPVALAGAAPELAALDDETLRAHLLDAGRR